MNEVDSTVRSLLVAYWLSWEIEAIGGVTCKISLTEEYLSGERMSAGLEKRNLFFFFFL